MNRQTVAVIVGAIVLFAVAVVGTMAFTGGSSNSGGNVHTMPDGSIMTGPTENAPMMGDDSMMGDGMGMSP